MADIDEVKAYCEVSKVEEEVLTSSEAPIVLLSRLKSGTSFCTSHFCADDFFADDLFASNVAPDTNMLGFMLPNSPLQQLILAKCDFPLVMTSGNVSQQPQCIDNLIAKASLKEIADIFLFHDRDIIHCVDDSVVQVINGNLHFLRRARGYAPAPIELHYSFKKLPPVLALGGEQKNTFCLLKNAFNLLYYC